MRHAAARVPVAHYLNWFQDLPAHNQREMTERWGAPPGSAYVHEGYIALAGLELGNTFLALQPPRGYGMDPNAIYHTPDLAPPHHYYALYRWLRDEWGADAIVHMGKHGTLEWLPGKGVGVSDTCYPDQFLADLPLFYPFIINDPGEGAQAKRRTHAVVVDHMIPPMTHASAYGDLATLAQLVDEYYQVEMLDPTKLPLLQQQIWQLMQSAKLDEDLKLMTASSLNHGDHTHTWDDQLNTDGTPESLTQMRGKDFAHLMEDLDGYLCELAGAQIRDGLHILGHIATDEQLVDLLCSLTRLPNLEIPSQRAAVAALYGLELEKLLAAPGQKFAGPTSPAPFSAREVGGEDRPLPPTPSPTGRGGGEEIPNPPTTFPTWEVGGEDRPLLPTPSPTGRGGDEEIPNPPTTFPTWEVGGEDRPLPPTPSPTGRGGESTEQSVSPALSEPGPGMRSLSQQAGRPLVTHADAIEAIDAICHDLYRALAGANFQVAAIPEILTRFGRAEEEDQLHRMYSPSPLRKGLGVRSVLDSPLRAGEELGKESLSAVLTFVCSDLLPNLRRTGEEISNLLKGLEGRYVPAGPSGAPTRGMAHVLPTGRNFYAVDPRALPSQVAWTVGQNLASELIARYVKEEGRYPESIGLSIWGTSVMRTHGDDIAQVFALLGVRPRWQPENRRLLGIEPIALAELGRPRVDVVCRISGFFRDAFPHLINLLDEAVATVANLDEPDEQNFVRKHVHAAQARGMEAGLSEEEAGQQARYRVFGSKPGTYGAGILPLIDEGNWQDSADFAQVYVNWGGYAYTSTNYGVDARDAFKQVLSGVNVAVKNQDNREHDLFDSDDYLQFHGGMIATIRALTGKNPRRYYGDNSDPAGVKVRDLREETLRVFRSRVVNPKWIASIQRHGYKGALELTATVDFLFGYDATAEVVEDWMYEQLANSYALDPKMQEFFKQSNPWAWRDIAKRLLEAIGRGMWANPGTQKAALESAFLDAETALEERQETTAGR